MLKRILCLFILVLAAQTAQAQAAAPTQSRLSIDGDFPAGNILVDRIEGDDVFVRQDLRDTAGWWFYWHFRVRGADGRTVRFHFTNQNVWGPQGPAYSLDGGAHWLWQGSRRSSTDQSPPKDGFVFRFPARAADVRFCFAIPLIQFIGGPDRGIWRRTLKLSQWLESCQAGPLHHDAKRNVPFGVSWNQGNAIKSATFAAWAGGLPNIQIATTIEIPYAQVGQTPQSADAARRLGRDLAVAIKTYLEKDYLAGRL